MEIKVLPVSRLLSNEGQIKGLPRNPRLIRSGKFERLKKSLQDDPEMLNLRELIVFPYGLFFVVIAGNMRFAAAKDVGFTELPCKILPIDTPAEKLRAYTIKDNVSFGEDSDDLLTEWDEMELQDFGMDMFVEPDPDAFLPAAKPIPVEKPEIDESVMAQRAESYLNNTIRQIVLYYENDEHRNTLDRLSAAGEAFGIKDDNSEIVLKLLEFFENC